MMEELLFMKIKDRQLKIDKKFLQLQDTLCRMANTCQSRPVILTVEDVNILAEFYPKLRNDMMNAIV